jgi:cytochrome P450
VHLFLNGGNDVIFSDGPAWVTLRTVFLMAIRKVSISERLPCITSEVVDEVIEKMMKQEKDGKTFAPKIYLEEISENVVSMIAFGKR